MSHPISAGPKTDFKYSYYCRECIIKAHFNLHSPSIKIELIDPDKGYVHYPLLRIWSHFQQSHNQLIHFRWLENNILNHLK